MRHHLSKQTADARELGSKVFVQKSLILHPTQCLEITPVSPCKIQVRNRLEVPIPRSGLTRGLAMRSGLASYAAPTRACPKCSGNPVPNSLWSLSEPIVFSNCFITYLLKVDSHAGGLHAGTDMVIRMQETPLRRTAWPKLAQGRKQRQKGATLHRSCHRATGRATMGASGDRLALHQKFD
jgi:hypothetical protein